MDEPTYLVTKYAEREQVKALGARWDAARKSWYVPAGRDLEPFTRWLPAGVAAAPGTALQPPPAAGTDLLAPARRGVTLSQLLAGVARAVAASHAEGVWTMVEVVDARLRNGHVYLEVSERGAAGEVAAKAQAIVWANTANRILPPFEQATGAKIGPGIKLLLRLRPVFKPQYGFSLEVDAIDPEYTLGDLEARKREIRTRLQREGLFDANRRLPPPWDFNAVLVVAPDGAAGLGDFRAEADRLQRAGICRFVYATSRFQGDGAAAEIRAALLGALQRWPDAGDGSPLPDAAVVIRGGGAVNDLAWLNDYDLARAVCEAPVPVFTGIGHERDATVLDEVAHQAFDTPSKVILGIEQAIHRRVRQAEAHFRKRHRAGRAGAAGAARRGRGRRRHGAHRRAAPAGHRAPQRRGPRRGGARPCAEVAARRRRRRRARPRHRRPGHAPPGGRRAQPSCRRCWPRCRPRPAPPCAPRAPPPARR
ncbi:MAG: exodeoxyribonuclease VII large subunit [Comamonadaceae bacterium]|nr:exodeoxyribonuclease VII large subunit [Comamonadaceae bacterium]